MFIEINVSTYSFELLQTSNGYSSVYGAYELIHLFIAVKRKWLKR